MARRTEPQAEAYLDTSAFIAFLDRSDSYHALYRRLFAQPPRLVTSGLVVAEGHGWFLRRYDFNRAVQFMNFLGDLPALTVEPFGTDAIAPARRLLDKFSDQPLTLADAHGLVIMSQQRIRNCWSTNRHLGLTGSVLAR
ncbi:MAG: PilT protein domain protein [Bryobacterales bacterium]|jgi:predicted nucleic acid-binding protein|nr:PilT protein domain protein [Bryobacterales bacterium]